MKFLSTLILIAFVPFFGITQCQDSIYLSGHTLHAGISGMNYQWYSNCTATGPGGFVPIPGATSQIFTPTHFTTDYSVVISGTPSCRDTSACVLIDSNCRAYFYPTQTTPGQVVLVDSSYGAGTAIGYTWNFGDGSVAFTQYPTHSYASPGTYQVTLHIYDTLSGCSNFYHDTITVDSAGILRSGFTVTVISHNSVGVAELASTVDFNLFPNPTSGKVFVNFPEVQLEGVIELFNVNGKLIASTSTNGLNQVVLDSQNLETGIYLVRVNTRRGQTTKKLIVK